MSRAKLSVRESAELCGSSSVGRASPCHGEGRGFESRLPLWPWGLRRWRHGRVVRQGSAKPCTPVRFRVPPLGADGRLAQGESASLTRKRSVVRIHYRPLQNNGNL